MSSEVQQILIAVPSLCPKDKEELAVALDRELRQSLAGPNKEQVEAIRGKYAHLPTSSADFMTRKRVETESER